MVLYTIAVIILIMILAVLTLVWLRKVQFDAVHRNFLDLVDHFGGRVVRGGFAIRPRYSGNFKNQQVSISISSESWQKQRRFYIAVTMQSRAKINFSIISRDWLESREAETRKKSHAVDLMDGRYLLEVSNPGQLKKLNIASLNKIVERLHPFAYVLIAKTGIILERISTNLIKDTEFPTLNKLLENVYRLKAIVEK